MGKNASSIILFLVIICLVSNLSRVNAQDKWFDEPLSERIASYDIEVELDAVHHRLTATQTIFWQNPSDDTIRTIPFHLYLNAFKNTASTFYQESYGSGRFPDLAQTTEADWGWINIDKIKIGDGKDISDQLRYIHPDDDNENDQTVVELVLPQPAQPNGTNTHYFYGEDIIDFTWTASPNFEVVKEEYLGIQLELLINSEYSCCTDRYLESAKHAIDYLGERLMLYPFPKLTIVVPPLHGANAGAMEYPTLVTAPGMYGFPDWLRSPEYFVVHEFVHQYFMMMVAKLWKVS